MLELSKTNKDKYLKYTLPIGFLVLNIALKLFFLTGRSIAGDEPFSIYHAQLSLPAIVEQLSKGNNPPLFEMMLHFWIQLFGTSPLATRMLPVLFSSASVVLIYKIGRKFFNLPIAIAASFMFCFSNFQFFISHETRVYTFFGLMTAVSMYSFMSLTAEPQNRKQLFVLSFANIVLAYSHFFGLFIPVIQLFSCVVYKEVDRRFKRKYFLSLIILFMAYMPYLKVVLTRFFASAKEGTWVAPSKLSDLLTVLQSYLNNKLLALLFVLCIFIAILKHGLNRFIGLSFYTKTVFTWFALPYLLMFVVSWEHFLRPVPMFFDRYMIFLSIGLYLTFCISIDYIVKELKFKAYYFALAILFVLITFKPSAAEGTEIEHAVAKVKQSQTKNSIVYLSPGWFIYNFTYYYNKQYFANQVHYKAETPEVKLQLGLTRDNVFAIYDSTEVGIEKLKTYDRIIFLDAGCEFEVVDNRLYDFFKKKFIEKEAFMEGTDIFKVYVFEPKK